MDISGIHKTIVAESGKLCKAYEGYSSCGSFILNLHYHFEGTAEKVHTVAVNKIVGQGASKKAVDIGNGQVLMLPGNFGTTAKSPNLWKGLVKDETAYSKYTSQSGLLSVNSRMVKVWLNSPTESIDAYVSDSFTSFASKGIYIIDPKVPGASTWNLNIDAKTFPSHSRREMRKLFSTQEQLFNFENWTPLLRGECIRDFLRLQKTGLILFGDSVSIAVYTNKDLVPQQIRPIFFDFCHEMQSLKSVDSLTPLDENVIYEVFCLFISQLVRNELRAHNLLPIQTQELSDRRTKLIEDLANKCLELFDEYTREQEA